LQHNYARAFVGSLSDDTASVCSVGCDSVVAKLTIVNRYDFLNLKHNVIFHWTLTNNRDTVARGTFSPDCAPRSSVKYSLTLPKQRGLVILHFETEENGHVFNRQSFVLNKPEVQWTGDGDPLQMVQEQTVRTGRKPTIAEHITQKDRLPMKYLLPLDNIQVKAEVQRTTIDGGLQMDFTLTPDTADVFRSELGLAYLLDPTIDRVQWIGFGPFASYPGRHQANRYGIWVKHKDDIYFEGNHGGVDAALLTDKDGNGLLVTGDSLDLNFEQTDRGIVLTVNAAVSGQGPKFAKTAFPGWKKGDGPVSASFRLYHIKGEAMPQIVKRLFAPASDVPVPFMPFLTQYDTYRLMYHNIIAP
jgi:beta-galactosidase